MTAIMIFNVKSKYTAVGECLHVSHEQGRKEIMFFFYMYALTTLVEFLVISGIIATATDLYPARFFCEISF